MDESYEPNASYSDWLPCQKHILPLFVFLFTDLELVAEVTAWDAETNPVKDAPVPIKEPVKEPVCAAIISVAILALTKVNDPDISEAICAELDIRVLLNSDSAVVSLVLIDALAAVNEPEISIAIWAELDIRVLFNSDSAVVNLVLIEELVEVNR